MRGSYQQEKPLMKLEPKSSAVSGVYKTQQYIKSEANTNLTSSDVNYAIASGINTARNL
jgi:hypothetical protein